MAGYWGWLRMAQDTESEFKVALTGDKGGDRAKALKDLAKQTDPSFLKMPCASQTVNKHLLRTYSIPGCTKCLCGQQQQARKAHNSQPRETFRELSLVSLPLQEGGASLASKTGTEVCGCFGGVCVIGFFFCHQQVVNPWSPGWPGGQGLKFRQLPYQVRGALHRMFFSTFLVGRQKSFGVPKIVQAWIRGCNSRILSLVEPNYMGWSRGKRISIQMEPFHSQGLLSLPTPRHASVYTFQLGDRNWHAWGWDISVPWS